MTIYWPTWASGRIVAVLILVIVTAMVFLFMRLAAQGRKFYVRKIAGADALDEALDRATEMGGCVNFCVGDVAGLSGNYVSQTIAGFECLRYIAMHCAKLRTRLICSTIGRSGSGGDLVPIQTEIIRDAYAEAGHEEEFSPTIVRFLSGDREGYETAIYDLYVKEKVTTNVFIGAWAGAMPQPTIIAKSLGITHISGTARTVQMSLQACISDYFIMGEEIFALGGFLSKDEETLASIAMSDYIKYGLVTVFLVGNVALWLGFKQIQQWLLL